MNGINTLRLVHRIFACSLCLARFIHSLTCSHRIASHRCTYTNPRIRYQHSTDLQVWRSLFLSVPPGLWLTNSPFQQQPQYPTLTAQPANVFPQFLKPQQLFRWICIFGKLFSSTPLVLHFLSLISSFLIFYCSKYRFFFSVHDFRWDFEFDSLHSSITPSSMDIPSLSCRDSCD